MKRGIIAFLCVACFHWTSFAVPAVVDYVFDGDTFAATVMLEEDVGIGVRVRLINVDTPEIHGKCDFETEHAKMARERLIELAPRGTIVDLQNIKDDKYPGRIDANVILADGRDVGLILINEKLGRPYSGGRRASWCE